MCCVCLDERCVLSQQTYFCCDKKNNCGSSRQWYLTTLCNFGPSFRKRTKYCDQTGNWNCLPHEIRHLQSTTAFRTTLIILTYNICWRAGSLHYVSWLEVKNQLLKQLLWRNTVFTPLMVSLVDCTHSHKWRNSLQLSDLSGKNSVLLALNVTQLSVFKIGGQYALNFIFDSIFRHTSQLSCMFTLLDQISVCLVINWICCTFPFS